VLGAEIEERQDLGAFGSCDKGGVFAGHVVRQRVTGKHGECERRCAQSQRRPAAFNAHPARRGHDRPSVWTMNNTHIQSISLMEYRDAPDSSLP
jgi:hypothetical protein